jgi:hypothetical protein
MTKRSSRNSSTYLIALEDLVQKVVLISLRRRNSGDNYSLIIVVVSVRILAALGSGAKGDK